METFEIQLMNFIQGALCKAQAEWLMLGIPHELAQEISQESKEDIPEGFKKAFGMYQQIRGKNRLWYLLNKTEIALNGNSKEMEHLYLYVLEQQAFVVTNDQQEEVINFGRILGTLCWKYISPKRNWKFSGVTIIHTDQEEIDDLDHPFIFSILSRIIDFSRYISA